jgi:uncharacterized membrane protein YedE/YeeE
MISSLMSEYWSPHIVGVGIGILSWFTFLFSNKPLGCSTAFVSMFGIFEKKLIGKRACSKKYYQKVKPEIDWQVLFVIGIIIGALISSLLSGSFRISTAPSLWVDYFGQFPLKRLLIGFFGGILLGFGSRWAGGCTSGHGISGTLQLAVSSWIAVCCFFISGIVTAFILYR